MRACPPPLTWGPCCTPGLLSEVCLCSHRLSPPHGGKIPQVWLQEETPNSHPPSRGLVSVPALPLRPSALTTSPGPCAAAEQGHPLQAQTCGGIRLSPIPDEHLASARTSGSLHVGFCRPYLIFKQNSKCLPAVHSSSAE